MLYGATCGPKPWHTAGRPGRRPWRGRPTARPWVFRAGAQCPSASARDDVTYASRPSISGSPCGWRSFRLATPGVSWRLSVRLRLSQRSSTTLVGWDRPLSFCHNISTAGAHTTRLSLSPSAPLALATANGDVVLHALANLYLGVPYQFQGDYRRAIDCFRETVASLDGERCHERFGQFFLPAVVSRTWLGVCHAELGTFAEGRTLGEEGLADRRGSCAPRQPCHGFLGGRSAVPPSRGDLPRARPLLNGP